ncbi:MAG: hypothetical protein KF678_09250 [Phycisphaeraceae bacterium]|nr:hypothetical protein [Phycisphaeraceae bacterium]
MTSEQTMLSPLSPACCGRLAARCAAFARATVALVAAMLVAACAPNHEQVLQPPQTLIAPYDASGGDALWAVVPLRNESGTTVADPYMVSDKVVGAASQVRGVRCLPLNRTIAAMRALDLQELTRPEEAEALAKALGVDALLVGSITAYDPYNPPKLGIALALYTRPGFKGRPTSSSAVDPRKLTYQPTDYSYFPRSAYANAPASVVSEYLDGKNHQVMMDIKAYAAGRHDDRTALGWRRFLASMDLFCEFGAWHGVNRLLQHEWIRMARVPVADSEQQP